jgi:hypothetical protein
MAFIREHHLQRTILIVATIATLLLAACGSNGLPSADGVYPIQSRSVTWDGDQYKFYWADSSGSLHQAHSKDVKLVQDSQDFLQMQDRKGVLRLQPTEPINVLGRDERGGFSDSWFPFLAGAAIGNALGGGRGPTYYYPPTNVYGRGDQIDGSVTTSSPKPPDYSTIKTPPNAVHPAPGSVAGQNSGTGGGNAASNKLGGVNNAAPSGASGQSGGTGSGGAAGNKSGSSSSGSGGKIGSGSAPRPAPIGGRRGR